MCGQRRAAPGHVISADHGRPVGTVDMWIARISASSAAPSRARISSTGPLSVARPRCTPRGRPFHPPPQVKRPPARNSLQFAGCAKTRTPQRPGTPPDTVVERIRPSCASSRIFPHAALTTNPPRPALTPELPTLPRGQLRAANGSVIPLDHGRSSGAVDVWTMLTGPPMPHLLLTFLQFPAPRRSCRFPPASALYLPAQVALVCSTSFRDWTAKIHPPRYDPAPRSSPRMRRSLERETAHFPGEICAAPEKPEVMNATSSPGSGGIPAPFQARHTPCNVVAACRASADGAVRVGQARRSALTSDSESL